VAHGKPPEVFKEPLLKAVYDMKMKVIDRDGREFVLR
jgi:ABC-type cobalamin/Fe3+-siderophores transport system ATPase subunit